MLSPQELRELSNNYSWKDELIKNGMKEMDDRIKSAIAQKKTKVVVCSPYAKDCPLRYYDDRQKFMADHLKSLGYDIRYESSQPYGRDWQEPTYWLYF